MSTRLPIDTRLVRAIADTGCVLFVGSGLSTHAKGFPTWTDLVTALHQRLPPEAQQNVSVGDALAHKLEFLEYMDVNHGVDLDKNLEDILRSRELEESRPHDLIAQMPFTAIITMNLDSLIEEAYRRQSREPIVITTEDDIVRLGPENGVPIFKMHGSVLRTTFRVLSLKDYERFDSERRTMMAILVSYVARYPMLIIGSGLSDPNFQKLHSIVNATHGEYRNPVYYVHPGLPKFVEARWAARKFRFVPVAFDDLTAWLEALRAEVDSQRQEMSKQRGTYVVSRFLKTHALESLGAQLDDYKSLQCQYTRQIHMPDYGWFTRSWEDSLYSPLAERLNQILARSPSPASPSLVYCAPGSHAPVLFAGGSKINKLGRLLLVDIDSAALAGAAERLAGSRIADTVRTAAEDLTCGVGTKFCNLLSRAARRGTVSELRRAAWEDEFGKVDKSALVGIASRTDPFDVAYSEMVAAFTVTPAILAFRSRIYRLLHLGELTRQKADELITGATEAWQSYNLAFFKFHLAMLAEMLKPSGFVVVAVDTSKLYDDNRNERETTFSQEPASIDTSQLSLLVMSNQQLMWRDHDYGFPTSVHGVDVPDFTPHRHEISFIVYTKRMMVS